MKLEVQRVTTLQALEICLKMENNVSAIIATSNEVTNKNHKCDICSKSFSVSDHLVRHIKTDHEGHKKHKSRDCNNKLFSQADHLEDQTNIHEGQIETKIDAIIEENHQVIKSYKCKFCNQIFEEYVQLKIHIRDIHLKPDENGIIEVPINIPKLREECHILF